MKVWDPLINAENYRFQTNSFFPFQTNFIDVSTFLARRHVMHVYRSRQKFVFSLKHVPKKLPPQMVVEKYLEKLQGQSIFLEERKSLKKKVAKATVGYFIDFENIYPLCHNHK
jgi:hypothetical protein